MKPFAFLGTTSVLALAGAWFAGNLASPSGSDRAILRIGLTLIVLIGTAIVAWVLLQKKKLAAPVSSQKSSGGDQLDLILREAEAKLAGAKLGPGTRISNLPAYIFIGPASTAKTTCIAKSGLEPELLAGEVFTDDAIASTPYANLWYGKQSIFVEAGQTLLNDETQWLRLVKYLAPGKLKSAIHQGGQAPRVIVLCFETETLLRQPLEANVTAARVLRGRLSQFAAALGISVPVYVLFTKADRTPFFAEFVSNLDTAESNQIFGATLPLAPATGGTYGEEQTARLNESYRQLFYSLAAKRVDYLRRERLLEKTPAIYEFPREFRKLRAAAVPFLVELCRPSQLTIGPFLRGFYFCGVRPVVVQETAASPAAMPETPKALHSDSEATQIFNPRQHRSAQPRVDLVGSHEAVRKVPQWVFLSGFFKDVLLADEAASGTSGTSANTNLTRRWLLGAAAALCLFFSAGFAVSFFQNREMESTAIAAAEGTSLTLDPVQRLDVLKESFKRLSKFDRDGAPLSFRWGLYSGDGLYPLVRKIYFDRFQQVLLTPIQQAWVNRLKKPGGADYQHTYDTLKGYLITTSHHEKSSNRFLTQLLAADWTQLRRRGSDRAALAREQFELYGDELIKENPYSSDPDAEAVKNARDYLSGFGGLERIYQFMLAETNKTEKSVNFNRDVKDSAQEVLNNKDVAGAFTKGGWAKMQSAIQNANSYFSGEQWVLGEAKLGANIDRANLEQELRKRYLTDFLAQWRDYLNRSVVVRYKDVKDAAAKLSVISGSQSPLLALFHIAAQNTAVDSPEVKKAFAPLYAVMPVSSVDQYIGPSNSDYMKELAEIQLSLEEIVTQGGTPTDAALSKSLELAKTARLKTRQMALAFGMDPEAHLDRKMQELLEAPITSVEPVIRPGPPSGQGLCREISVLTSKYPFNPKATVEATIADVNSVFQPKEGAIWKFYEANLQKILVLQGSQYVQAPGALFQLTQRFLTFFNRAAAISKAFYSENPASPHLSFKLKPVKIEGVSSVTIQMNGQFLFYNGSSDAKPVAFEWPGKPSQVNATTNPPHDWLSVTGLWAAYDFLSSPDRVERDGSISHLEYDVRSQIGPRISANTTRRVVSFDLDMGANPPIFQKGYLSSVSCVADVAK